MYTGDRTPVFQEGPFFVEVEVVTEYFSNYRGADKSLARPGRKKATATEDLEFHISYLES
jgi:hypothetical protein